MPITLTLHILTERFALIQLPQNAPIPSWVRGEFAAVLRSRDEMTVVSEESAVPAGLRTQGGFRCLQVAGSFDIGSIGIAAAATRPVAEAGISLFVFSTWQTDFVLVAESDLEHATAALRGAGHTVL
jgi:hypothetical protein